MISLDNISKQIGACGLLDDTQKLTLAKVSEVAP